MIWKFFFIFLLCIDFGNCSRSLASNKLEIIAGNSYEDFDFDNQDSKRRDLSLGKDRELFYASVDFKWIVTRMTDYKCWISAGKQFLSSMLAFVRGADPEDASRKNAQEIWAYIRNIQKSSPLKCFQGNLLQLESYARYQGKPILLYVEDGSFTEPSVACLSFRLALSDPSLGAFINDNYVFYIARYNQKTVKRLIDSMSPSTTKLSFPYLSVLSPVFTLNNAGTLQKIKGTPNSLRELRRYSSALQDIKASKIVKFLQKVTETCTPKLISEKKSFESMYK